MYQYYSIDRDPTKPALFTVTQFTFDSARQMGWGPVVGTFPDLVDAVIFVKARGSYV
jgi:hypothetical protein